MNKEIQNSVVPCLMAISSSGFDQRELVKEIAMPFLVSKNCLNVVKYLKSDHSTVFKIENGVTACGFSQLDKEDFDDLGLTKIGKKLVLKILPEVKD